MPPSPESEHLVGWGTIGAGNSDESAQPAFTAIQKDAGRCCGSRLRSGEVFAYVGRNQNLKDLKAQASMRADLGVEVLVRVEQHLVRHLYQ